MTANETINVKFKPNLWDLGHFMFNGFAAKKIFNLLTTITILFVTNIQVSARDYREWSDIKGRKVMASYEGMKHGKVKLGLKSGRVVPYSLELLSTADQEWVKNLIENNKKIDKYSDKDIKGPPFVMHSEMDNLLDQYCYSCHDQDTQKGEIRLDNLADLSQRNRLDLLNKMHEQMYFKQMPPEKKKSQPSDTVRKKMVTWISNELKKYNALELEDKMRFADYGNYVNHEKLFSGEINAKAFTPKRRWLVSPQIFHSRVSHIFNLGKNNRTFYGVTNPFVLSDHSGVRYYDYNTLDGGHLLTMLTNAEWITQKQIRAARVKNKEIKADYYPNKKDRWAPSQTPVAFEDIILSKSTPTKSQMIAAIQEQFNAVLQRQANDQEIEKYLSLLQTTIKIGGNTEGLRQMLISVILESEFLYRIEFGAGTEDKYGRKKLSPREASYAIAYAISDYGPDEKLIAAAESGNLTSKKDYEREVVRLLNDKNSFMAQGNPTLSGKNLKSKIVSHPKINRFFREFFGYDKSVKIFKDSPRSGGFYKNAGRGSSGTAGQVTDEADKIVDLILNDDKNVFEQLLTTEKNFVYHPHDNETGVQIVEDWKKVYTALKDTNWREKPYEVGLKHKDLIWNYLKIKPTKKSTGNKRHGADLVRYMEYFEHTFGNGKSPFTRLYWSHGFNFRYSEIYNLPASAGSRGSYGKHDLWDYPAVQPFKIPNRKGILTHPAWLIAHSQNSETDPVHRGKWVREKLLAGRVPDIPITVDAQIPEDHHKTLRERLDSATNKSECWKCHKYMNPLGLPFEAFDDFGRFREREQLEHPENIISKGNGKSSANKYKTKPVNTQGSLIGTKDPKLDGNVDDVFELIDRLAKSSRVRQSIIRHAFRYFMGRNEMLSDSQTLIDADNAYLNSEGSFKAVIISLLTSDSFMYRK